MSKRGKKSKTPKQKPKRGRQPSSEEPPQQPSPLASDVDEDPDTEAEPEEKRAQLPEPANPPLPDQSDLRECNSLEVMPFTPRRRT